MSMNYQVICVACRTIYYVHMTMEQFQSWKSGEHVQVVFPELTPSIRELLISGTCPTCWTKLFMEKE